MIIERLIIVKKVYKCCICHKTLKDKPIRLTKQLYGIGRYNQYNPVANYDFCDKCYGKFNAWIRKHKIEKSDK